jgi:hypothetical protein
MQHRFQHIQHEFDDICGFIFRNTDLLVDFVRDICLSHAFPSDTRTNFSNDRLWTYYERLAVSL